MHQICRYALRAADVYSADRHEHHMSNSPLQNASFFYDYLNGISLPVASSFGLVHDLQKCAASLFPAHLFAKKEGLEI